VFGLVAAPAADEFSDPALVALGDLQRLVHAGEFFIREGRHKWKA
jgi:hypothetical protein